MLDLTDWWSKKYQTKNGIPVRILCVDAPGPFPIIGLEGPAVRSWNKYGIYDSCGSPSRYDLINAKTAGLSPAGGTISCLRGETGRRKGLKIPRLKGHAGSTPAASTS